MSFLFVDEIKSYNKMGMESIEYSLFSYNLSGVYEKKYKTFWM